MSAPRLLGVFLLLFVFSFCFEGVLGHSNSCIACYICDFYLSQGQADA